MSADRNVKKRRKPALGDIYEIETTSGLGYFQYVGTSKRYCELIRVFPGTYSQRPSSFEETLSRGEAFMTFYPLPRALSEELVTWVHHEALPERFRVFPMMRWGTGTPPSGGARKWRLFDGEDFGALQEMTPELAKMSVAGTSGHASLKNKIETGYTPESEV